MEEIKCKQVAQIEGSFESTGRVYSAIGLSPTINTCGGGDREPKILVEPLAYDEQNGYLREDGIVGTLKWIENIADYECPKCNSVSEYASAYCTNCGARLHYEKDIEPIVYDGFNQQVKTDSSIIGTITRNVGADLKRNGQGIIEPDTVFASEYDLSDKMKRYINSYDDKYQVSDSKLTLNKSIASPVTTREGCSRADASSYISKDFPENANVAKLNLVPYRVRKLTEKECFRLMGVKDNDFAKVRANQSKSSCYHLAGDSIVTTCLMALFGEMIDVNWEEKVNAVVAELQDK